MAKLNIDDLRLTDKEMDWLDSEANPGAMVSFDAEMRSIADAATAKAVTWFQAFLKKQYDIYEYEGGIHAPDMLWSMREDFEQALTEAGIERQEVKT